MKAKILSMVLALCMIVSLVAVLPASATDAYVTTVCDGTTVIDYLKYSQGYNSNDATTGAGVMQIDGAASMVVRVSDWVEYELDVEEAGYYTVALNSTVGNLPLHTWNIYVDGTKETEGYTWYPSWDGEVGDIYLPAGRHTLKLENAAGWWRYLLGITLTKKVNDTKAIWVVGSAYTSGAQASGAALGMDTGRVIYHVGSWAEYNVNVPAAGKYLMSLSHSYNTHGAIPTITVNGTDVTGLKMAPAFDTQTSAVSDRSGSTALSPVAYIDLVEGENTIKITHGGNAMMLRSFKLDPVELGVGFAIQADAPTSTTGSPGTEGNSLVIGAGKSASYEVEIPSDGTYMISAYSGSTAGTVGAYNLSVDGKQVSTKTFVFQDWRGVQKNELATVDLKAGARTLTITPSNFTSGHYLRHILVEKVDVAKTVTSDGAIAVEDGSKSVVDAADYARANASLAVSDSGNITLGAAEKAIYKVNVLRDGVYTLSLKYAATADRTLANIKVDGKTALAARLQYAQETAMLTVEAGDITLSKGLHEIEIMNSYTEGNTDAAIYLDELYLERKDLSSEAIWVWAGDYSATIDGTAGDTATGIEGPGIALRNTDTAEYSVYIPKAGIYRFSVMAGSSTLTYTVSVDGESVEWLGTVLPKRYTSGINEHVLQPICDLYFDTAGVHTISLANPTGGAHYVSKLKIDAIDSEENPSFFYVAATDYTEAYDAATDSTAPGVEGGNVTFGPGDTLTYEAYTFEDGYYKVSMIGSRDSTLSNDVTVSINGEAATFAGQFAGSGSWTAVNTSDLGIIYLPAGNNTLTLKTTSGSATYFYALILEPVTNIPSATVVSGAETEIDLQTMLGTQTGTEAMIVGNLNGVRVYKDSAVSYDLDVLEAGTYNVYITSTIPAGTQAEVGVQMGDYYSSAAAANSKGSTFITFKAGTFDLAEGAVSVSVSAVSGDFALGAVSIEKVKDVEIDIIKMTDEAKVIDNTITEGNFNAQIALNNGAYENENLICTFVVYKTDANGIKKIDGIVSQTIAASDLRASLDMSNVTFEEGMTYSAMVYVWNADTLYGESKVF